jgi:hypothetical protein
VTGSVLTRSPKPTVVVPPTDAPGVSFVLVSYGTGHILIETLESIVSATTTIEYEVIVVDNAHPRAVDRSYTELILHSSGVRVLRPDTNLGFGGGCNAGAELARGGILAFVNPDVTLGDGCIERLIQVLDDDPTVWLVAPTLLNADGSIQECGQVIYADGTTRPRRRRPDVLQPFDVDYASAACWLVRTDRFRELDGAPGRSSTPQTMTPTTPKPKPPTPPPHPKTTPSDSRRNGPIWRRLGQSRYPASQRDSSRRRSPDLRGEGGQ